jgi:hypothetical protein
MAGNPYHSPRGDHGATEKSKRRWMPSLIGVLAVLGVIAMLIGLLIPARRGTGEPGRANTCRNNIRNVILALVQYESAHGELPPAYTVDAEGKPLHSWRTLILPFLDQHSLYEKIDLTKPWDDPANQAARDASVELYQCPSAGCPPTHTVYFAMVGPDRCLRPGEPRKLAEITDDHGLTLMIAEGDTADAVHWMSPVDAAEPTLLNLKQARRLAHPGGVNAATLDGRVLFVGDDTDPARLDALISIAGGDDTIAHSED